MLGSIERYAGSSAMVRGAATDQAPGEARSVDAGDWSQDVLTFEDLGAPALGDRPVASMARMLPGARRRGNPPEYFRRRVGWWAGPTSIVTAVSEQPLQPRPDGRFRTAGPWSGPRLEELRPLGKPVRRVGDVPHDRTFTGDGAQGAAAGTPFDDALSHVAYLPEPVRRGIAARVPVPTFFEAEAVRYAPDRGAPWHAVQVLKMDDSRALVVAASRQADAPTWQVEQVVYDLSPERRRLTA